MRGDVNNIFYRYGFVLVDSVHLGCYLELTRVPLLRLPQHATKIARAITIEALPRVCSAKVWNDRWVISYSFCRTSSSNHKRFLFIIYQSKQAQKPPHASYDIHFFSLDCALSAVHIHFWSYISWLPYCHFNSTLTITSVKTILHRVRMYKQKGQKIRRILQKKFLYALTFIP